MVNLSFKELDFLNLIEFSKKVPQSEVLFIYYSLSSSSTLILNSLSCSSSATAGAFVIGQTALWFLGNAITSFMLLVPVVLHLLLLEHLSLDKLHFGF